MLFRLKLLLAIFILSTALIGCNGGEMSKETIKFPSIKDIPAAKWEKLSQKKIYFGHQSVGFNIIDGIKDLMKENPQIKLNIVETADQSDFKLGLFAHSRVGKNVDSNGNLTGFRHFIRNIHHPDSRTICFSDPERCAQAALSKRKN